MKTQLVAQISGTRNGEPWPEPPAIVDLPEDEVKQLEENGLARKPRHIPAAEVVVIPVVTSSPVEPAPILAEPAVVEPSQNTETSPTAPDGEETRTEQVADLVESGSSSEIETATTPAAPETATVPTAPKAAPAKPATPKPTAAKRGAKPSALKGLTKGDVPA